MKGTRGKIMKRQRVQKDHRIKETLSQMNEQFVQIQFEQLAPKKAELTRRKRFKPVNMTEIEESMNQLESLLR